MESHTAPARERGPVKMRHQIGDAGPDILSVARVPARLIRALLRHRVDTDELYQTHNTGYRPVGAETVRKQFANTISGQKIELLIAVFARANKTPEAIFRSQAEWIEMASGKKARQAPEYHQAIRAVAEDPHWLLDKENERHIVSCKPPVQLGDSYSLDAGGEQRRDLSVQIADAWRTGPDSFHQVPLALSWHLRQAGLAKVCTAHVLLYLYVLTRVQSRHPQYTMSLENIIRATGLEHHLANRKRKRAVKLITTGLDAMQGAGMLVNWSFGAGQTIEFEPNKRHFRRREIARDVAQSRTSVSR